uniref:Uncharacterized protein n=1 Tax=Lepeophtheirus salmonis TaxID=72036 RepID=A0A0K2VFN9_LEPSM
MPNSTNYLSTPKASSRPTQAATTSRRAQNFNEMSSVEELVDKLAKEALPSNFILITKPSVALLKLSHDEKLGPKVVASIKFETDMSFKMYNSGVLIEKKAVSHITSEGKVNTVIQAS